MEKRIVNLIKNEKTKNNFEKQIKGYYIRNKHPFKESSCEETNYNFVESIVKVSDNSNGNYLLGKDIRINNRNLSNKKGKNNISIYSYSHMSICSDKGNKNKKENGNKKNIIIIIITFIISFLLFNNIM